MRYTTAKQYVDTEVLALSLGDGTVRSIGRLRGEIYPPETASTSDYLYDARGGHLVLLLAA